MELRDTVIAIIADTLNAPREQVQNDSKLVDIAHDSIALFELLTQLEKTFEYRVKYEEIAHIETVGDVIAYILSLPVSVPATVPSRPV